MSLRAGATLVLADEHRLFRAVMRPALETHAMVRVVAECADGHAAVTTTTNEHPDAVMLSSGLPGLDAFSACTALKRRAAVTRVVIVDERADASALQSAIEAGADGYVTKDMSLSALAKALVQVLIGQAYVPTPLLGGLLRNLVDRQRGTEATHRAFARLTPREREVLALLVEGCDHAMVADILVISPQTARTHIQNIMSKLGVHSRLEAAAMAAEHGLGLRQPTGRHR